MLAETKWDTFECRMSLYGEAASMYGMENKLSLRRSSLDVSYVRF
jgi:hypothetical protein